MLLHYCKLFSWGFHRLVSQTKHQQHVPSRIEKQKLKAKIGSTVMLLSTYLVTKMWWFILCNRPDARMFIPHVCWMPQTNAEKDG